jgi:hypothetical protein
MSIIIWCRHKGREAEKIDEAANQREANYLVGEYALAFGCRPGQFSERDCVVWAGRKKDDPTMQEHW